MCLESDSLCNFPIDPLPVSLTHLLMQTHGALFFFFFLENTYPNTHTHTFRILCRIFLCLHCCSFRSGNHQISLDFRPLWKKRSCSFCSEINLLGPQYYFSEKNYRNKDKMKDLDYGDHKIYFSKTLKWDGNILIVISRLLPKSRLVSGKLEV